MKKKLIDSLKTLPMSMEDKQIFADVILSNKGSNDGGNDIKAYYYKTINKDGTLIKDIDSSVLMTIIYGFSYFKMGTENYELISQEVLTLFNDSGNGFTNHLITGIKLFNIETYMISDGNVTMNGNLIQRIVSLGVDEQTAQSMVNSYFIEITEEEYNNL